MKKGLTAAITGVGGYVPDYILSNAVLETMIDTSDEWIRTRTGISERRILKEVGKGSSFMGVQAIKGTETAPVGQVVWIRLASPPTLP